MGTLLIKGLISGVLVVAISELAKRHASLGALIAALPLTSLLAMAWLYHDTGDVQQVATLARAIFWLVIPSLVLFVALPKLFALGMTFWPALVSASALTALAYVSLHWLLPRFGITLE